MHSQHITHNTRAVSEVVGAILLVLIAVVSAAVIYTQFLPVPLPSTSPSAQLMAYTEDGTPILEHMGGATLTHYEIYIDNTLFDTTTDGNWDIGEKTILQTLHLQNDTESIHITVYAVLADDSRNVIFDGILRGDPEDPSNPPTTPLLMTSLNANTSDEDLICYTHTITPNISPTTYIYSWYLNDAPLSILHLPMDTNNPSIIKDYSGNHHNATPINITTTPNGKLGRALSFSPTSHLSLPYIFPNPTIDTLTIETWIKTNQSNGLIVTYNATANFELILQNGAPKLTTTSNSGETRHISSSTPINDNCWHHLAVTYNWLTGITTIYIDGSPNTLDYTYAANTLLGIGQQTAGYIGLGTQTHSTNTIFNTSFESGDEYNNWKEHNGTEQQETEWETLTHDTFDDSWGNWEPTSYYYGRSTNYKHSGTRSAYMYSRYNVDNTIQLEDPIDLDNPEYTQLTLDFWWMWRLSWQPGYSWDIDYYDGTNWHQLQRITYPDSYEKETWYHTIITINETDYTFPDDMELRFTLNGGYYMHVIYLDDIYINATSLDDRVDYLFELQTNTPILPQHGSHYLTASGDFDPESIGFNRTSIDLGAYSNKTLEFYYAYHNATSQDFFGLYYNNNSSWSPLFTLTNPNGNQSWTHYSTTLPESLENLSLQLRWTTGSEDTYFCFDNLTITGALITGAPNYNGSLDHFSIYNRCLTHEQLYQNYLLGERNEINRSIIVSEQTQNTDEWYCIITPNDGTIDDSATETNHLIIIPYTGGD